MGCKKCAEEVCGCSTMNADESIVEEPDWIPAGDGRAIGQQNFGINLSPLHAETTGQPTRLVVAIDTSGSTAMDYKGRSHSHPKAYSMLKKYETMARQMAKTLNTDDLIILDWNGQGVHQATGELRPHNGTGNIEMIGEWLQEHKILRGGKYLDTVVIITDGYVKEFSFKYADTVGTPSPTFNEDITGQDGPSDSPTNAVFEGTKGVSYAGRYGPQAADMTRAREQLKRYGYIKDDGDIVQDIFLYNDTPSKKTGRKADKYHYFALIEKDDRYYAINIHGPSKSLRDVVNILGATGDKSYNMTSTGDARHARSVWLKKQNEKIKKGYRPVLFGKKGNIMEWTGSGFSAETLAEIEGPTAEATTGGLHAPSSFAMTWEDGMGQSSASIPPNEIAWAEEKSTSWMTWACGIALVLAGGALLKAKSGEQKAADNLVNVVNKRKGCCGGSRNFNAGGMSGRGIPQAEIQDESTCHANGCRWIPPSIKTSGRNQGSAVPAYCDCSSSTAQARQGGLQNQQDGGVTFQSEFSVGQINPVEVEGQNDVYGAEEHYRLSTPQLTQPHLGPQTTYRQNSRRNLKMW